MGMGYAGCRVSVVETDYVKTVCPSYPLLQAAIDKWEDEFEDNWWRQASFEDPVGDTWLHLRAVVSEFEARHPGLSIAVNFHCSDSDGSRYDEVDGGFWELCGAYVVHPEAEKISLHWEDKSFVQFG